MHIGSQCWHRFDWFGNYLSGVLLFVCPSSSSRSTFYLIMLKNQLFHFVPSWVSIRFIIVYDFTITITFPNTIVFLVYILQFCIFCPSNFTLPTNFKNVVMTYKIIFLNSYLNNPIIFHQLSFFSVKMCHSFHPYKCKAPIINATSDFPIGSVVTKNLDGKIMSLKNWCVLNSQ